MVRWTKCLLRSTCSEVEEHPAGSTDRDAPVAELALETPLCAVPGARSADDHREELLRAGPWVLRDVLDSTVNLGQLLAGGARVRVRAASRLAGQRRLGDELAAGRRCDGQHERALRFHGVPFEVMQPRHRQRLCGCLTARMGKDTVAVESGKSLAGRVATLLRWASLARGEASPRGWALFLETTSSRGVAALPGLHSSTRQTGVRTRAGSPAPGGPRHGPAPDELVPETVEGWARRTSPDRELRLSGPYPPCCGSHGRACHRGRARAAGTVPRPRRPPGLEGAGDALSVLNALSHCEELLTDGSPLATRTQSSFLKTWLTP